VPLLFRVTNQTSLLWREYMYKNAHINICIAMLNNTYIRAQFFNGTKVTLYIAIKFFSEVYLCTGYKLTWGVQDSRQPFNSVRYINAICALHNIQTYYLLCKDRPALKEKRNGGVFSMYCRCAPHQLPDIGRLARKRVATYKLCCNKLIC